MAEHQTASEKFRKILTGNKCVHPATVFDPISGVMAEELGFEAGIFAGAIASLTILAAPDLVLMTLSEAVEQARRVTRRCSVPLLVDGDHGYGNALNVMRTVSEMEAAGVAALSIEDTDLPLPFDTETKPRLLTIDEGKAKIKAALAARRSPQFVVVARTSAAAWINTDAAIERGLAYQAAGADALFFPGLVDKEQIKTVASTCKLPLIIGGIAPDAISRPWLSDHNVRLSLPGHVTYFAGLNALYQSMKTLRETGSFESVKHASKEDVARWSNAPAWQACADLYLGREKT